MTNTQTPHLATTADAIYAAYKEGFEAGLKAALTPNANGAHEHFQWSTARRVAIEALFGGEEAHCAECKAREERLKRDPGIYPGPSHRGSFRCESGSLASGGTRAHCSCDICL